MRVLALILSLIIFHQSLSVCGPKIGMSKNDKKSMTCQLDNKAKSCCVKLHKKDHQDNKDKKKKGSCGEDCKCLTCAKVFLYALKFYSLFEPSMTILAESNIMPMLVHSYDFHQTLTNPPQA